MDSISLTISYGIQSFSFDQEKQEEEGTSQVSSGKEARKSTSQVSVWPEEADASSNIDSSSSNMSNYSIINRTNKILVVKKREDIIKPIS